LSVRVFSEGKSIENFWMVSRLLLKPILRCARNQSKWRCSVEFRQFEYFPKEKIGGAAI